MATLVVNSEREALVRRGQWLSWLTLTYNCLEGIVGITAGVLAGSVALVGFGLDSLIELTASITALWRFSADVDPIDRERAEALTLKIVGALFLVLAGYVTWDAIGALVTRQGVGESKIGIAIAVASLVVMPLLARAKRGVAIALGSRALQSEAQQTQLCTYLSAILLGGLTLNAIVGWWWADPAAALAMVPIIVKEGVEALRGHDTCSGGTS
jgi:divalent metal cation (Fe/Co/Zn/Cd) transporter